MKSTQSLSTASLCACGCGTATEISKYTTPRSGSRKGTPLAYVLGHNARREVVACIVPDCERRGRSTTGMCTMHNRRVQRTGRIDLPTATERLRRGLIEVPSGCIEWSRSRNPDGYGKIQVEGKTVATHRFAWELERGPIPDGFILLHSCDNPSCCNVAHLLLGTFADNTADMIAKGRAAFQSRTLCKWGHELDSILATTGVRYCGECNRLRAQARRRGIQFQIYVVRRRIDELG